MTVVFCTKVTLRGAVAAYRSWIARASVGPLVTAIATEPGALAGGFAVDGAGVAAGVGFVAGAGLL
jgi:hypothetical protein